MTTGTHAPDASQSLYEVPGHGKSFLTEISSLILSVFGLFYCPTQLADSRVHDLLIPRNMMMLGGFSAFTQCRTTHVPASRTTLRHST